ncbi:MAG: hypothetical protein M1840_004513 [Geoglossum simile]|nr:MAG: hypothetical protein M1840_004513 [Geoglossum simile]
MALTVTHDQEALHSASIQAMNIMRGKRSWYSTPSWQAPAFKTAYSKAQEPTIPALSVFQPLGDVQAKSSAEGERLPSVAECAVHLELLQAIHQLRVDVLRSTELDSTFGIIPNPGTVTRGWGRRRRQIKVKDATFAIRRKEKWPLFLDLAVVRFQTWIQKVDSLLGAAQSDGTTAEAEADLLPPLDILMVWHSFLLNPKLYQQYCEQHGLKNVREAAFPWLRIYNSINPADWSFTLHPDAASRFQTATRLAPDLLEYLTKRGFSSPLLAILQKFPTRTVTLGEVSSTLAYHILRDDESAFLRCCRDIHPNSRTITTTQLADAVQRQFSFVEKMERALWIRSPALEGTLQRAVDRYSKFLKLFKWYPNTMLVPTLDIDLVWHTHQCSPSRYRTATIKHAGRFIDHDDKIGKPTLDSGLDKTEQLFRIRFGKEYFVCNCWDCEAILSSVTGPSRNGEAQPDMDAVAQKVSDEIVYYKAVELARRAKKPLPIQG